MTFLDLAIDITFIPITEDDWLTLLSCHQIQSTNDQLHKVSLRFSVIRMKITPIFRSFSVLRCIAPLDFGHCFKKLASVNFQFFS